MPFTLSHPATVLPFGRLLARWRLLSAAVIGSMAPDFGRFLPWQPARFETHSADALLSFCLPAGIVTYWVFQWLIKWPLIELLPPGAYGRWQGSKAAADVASVKQWLLAACGVLAGAVTHLIWDGFTHEGARGVRMFPVLEDPVMEIGGHRLVGAHLLQDANSVIGLGLVMLIVAYGLRPGRAEDGARPRPLHRGERWLWYGAYTAAAAILSFVLYLGRHHSLYDIPPFAGRLGSVAIAFLRGAAGALIGISAAVNLRLRLTHHRQGSPAVR